MKSAFLQVSIFVSIFAIELIRESDYNVYIQDSTLKKNKVAWGRSGFDRMFGESKLRVSELFRVINEQKQ